MSARPSSDDEEEGGVPKPNLFGAPRSAGVAIAPPPSLVESSPPANTEVAPPPKVASFGGSSVAAKIMAKYGFKVSRWTKSRALKSREERMVTPVMGAAMIGRMYS